MANTLTKEVRYTALWGGALARMTGQDGRWLGIPTGHLTANVSGGTSTHPVTTLLCAVNADDIGSVIWQPLSTITVRKCRIYYGEGGSTNTTHKVNLSRFDIDADGDLSNGYVIGATATDSNSDDYSQLRYTDLSITTTRVTSSQVLVAFVMCVDAVNATFTAKCIIEYTI
tara:strand:+ start:151 stop:663 length:513 start_codon:yes stop_codon:yes gene_type:complete